MPAQNPSSPPDADSDIRPMPRKGSPDPVSAPSAPQVPERRSRPRPEHGPHPSMHTVPFEVEDKSCSQVLFDLMQMAPRDGMTVRALIHALGERGLLMACMLFALPSMLPIPIPGMSVPQGLVITMIGLGIVLNRAPLLPERLLEYRLPHKSLFQILEKGARLFHRIEKLSYPRLLPLTHGWVHAFNGVLLVGGAVILSLPLPIPFSNVLPAYGILFTAFGTLQRDGWLVLAGYGMYLLTGLYLGLIFAFGMGGVMHLLHASWIHRLFH
jgi:hypothetical protein